MDRVIENLLEADKALQKANHLFYISFPLIKNKNLLIKIILETRNAVMRSITAILQYEYINKRISLSQDAKANFMIFEEKCAPRYEISQNELKEIRELFEITKKHQDSSMEVMTSDKIIILSKDMEQKETNPERIKALLEMAKDLFRKTKETMIKEKKQRQGKSGIY